MARLVARFLLFVIPTSVVCVMIWDWFGVRTWVAERISDVLTGALTDALTAGMSVASATL